MDELLIRGGRTLKGEINVSGAKNAALPALAASLLMPGRTHLKNIPAVRDIKVMCMLMSQLGIQSSQIDSEITIDASEITSCEAPYDLVRTMRASVLLLGPLITRLRRARVALPGGCAIGTRPIDIHLKAIAQLGANVEIDKGTITIDAQEMRGSEIYLDFPTVTGTENIMMAALGADGVTHIYNAAKEPEVADLGKLLNTMGFSIQGAGTDTITVMGGGNPKECFHTIIADRIEAGTYAMAAAVTSGEVTIKKIVPEHLTAVLAKLGQAGVDIEVGSDFISVRGSSCVRPVNIQTAVYPGYPTDLQAQFMALMCKAKGESVISENIFENRFMHVAELNRMGAQITAKGNIALVKGVAKLTGTSVMATDLRASASLVLAGLSASGETRILRLYHLDRGYEKLTEKLKSVGADIERTTGAGP